MDEDETEIVYSDKPIEPCWPFWGILRACGGGAFDWQHSCATPTLIAADVFARFRSIGTHALVMLKHRSIDELRDAAVEIQAAIEEWLELYIEQETESRVQELSRDGGWELGYLPHDARGTEDEIRHLLANWPNEWEDRPSLPGRDDFSDLTALQECLNFENFNRNEFIHLGLIEPEEHDFYGVLALMQICEAIHSNPINPGQPESLYQVKQIGHATIKALETIAHAERVQLEQKIRNSIALKQPEILEKELSRRASERAVNAANKKHLANNKARNWVCTEWTLHRDSYSGNKSEFSRIYAARVKNEFKDSKGEPLSVTDKTIREVWLKNTPTAGK